MLEDAGRTVNSRALRHRLGAALFSGTIAITANTLLLKAADFVPLATAHGGLLRLLLHLFGRSANQLGVGAAWAALGGPATSSVEFQTATHLVVGMLMALFYAYVLEPSLKMVAWLKGLLYAVGVWILNAAVVLPATGEGIAGSTHLTVAGMIWFAVAHLVFFMLLAMLYDAIRGRRRAATAPAH
jgi:hypothetical protein